MTYRIVVTTNSPLSVSLNSQSSLSLHSVSKHETCSTSHPGQTQTRPLRPQRVSRAWPGGAPGPCRILPGRGPAAASVSTRWGNISLSQVNFTNQLSCLLQCITIPPPAREPRIQTVLRPQTTSSTSST